MYIHTQKHAYTQIHVNTHAHTCSYIQTHVYTHVHTHVHTHTPLPHKKLQYFVVLSQIQVLHSRGRQRAQHTLFHCAQLLSSLTAPSANDRSGLSSKPAQHDGPGGHTCPHHNFHSPLASR
ncbi:unnamed protein product [Staurois parvus]|uniref:Uncharacterized protein n=1 Tax=Staurois parvus TaxID=386267 RepID=A0ABN9EVB0_9NEOB|nr:unnamed protein product [Staurois parvus]